MRHTRTRKQPSLAPPNVVPYGGSRHLSESGTDTNRPAKIWVRYRRCRDAVPAREGQAPPVCGSKYRYLVGSRQMVPEAALQVMLIRRPRPSGPSGILTRTPVKPTQPTQARTGIYRAACKVATSALTTCLHSPWQLLTRRHGSGIINRTSHAITNIPARRTRVPVLLACHTECRLYLRWFPDSQTQLRSLPGAGNRTCSWAPPTPSPRPRPPTLRQRAPSRFFADEFVGSRLPPALPPELSRAARRGTRGSLFSARCSLTLIFRTGLWSLGISERRRRDFLRVCAGGAWRPVVSTMLAHGVCRDIAQFLLPRQGSRYFFLSMAADGR